MEFKEKNLHYNRHKEDWGATLVDMDLETPKRARLKMVEPFLGGDTFMVTYRDGIADPNTKDLLTSHKSQKKNATCTGVHPNLRAATVNLDACGKVSG